MKEYFPQRGDIVLLDYDPKQGHEQAGKRPAIVISSLEYNKKVGLALFYPITSQIKGYPFEVKISLSKVQGVILSDQIKSLDWRARKAQYIETPPERLLDEAREELNWLLD